MKKVLAMVLSALLLSGCSAVSAYRTRTVYTGGDIITHRTAEEIVIKPASRKLPEHEELTYNVKWLGFSVGTITANISGIKKIQGRDAYTLEIIARTNEFLSNIYPVNDRYISYIDTENLYTLRHEVYRREGRYKKDAVTDFDQIEHKAHFRNMLDKSEKTIDIPPAVQDPVSMAYFFRTVPLEIGQRKEFHVYNNEATYLLYGVADRKEFVKIPNREPNEAFHIQPYAKLKGQIVKKGKASAYFSCDENRIPLLGVVKGPIFTEVIAYLEKAE